MRCDIMIVNANSMDYEETAHDLFIGALLIVCVSNIFVAFFAVFKTVAG
jgi:hypothetical protein